MPEEVAAWKERSEAPISGGGIRFLLFVYRWFGRWFSRLLAACALLACYPFLREARHASADYRKRWSAFTGRRFPGGGFRHILHFCYAMLDRVACWGGIFRKDRIKVRTPETVQRITEDFGKGKGAFFVLSHLGNAELLRAVFLPLARRHGRHIHVYLDMEPSRQFNEVLKSVNSDSSMSLHSTAELGVGSSIALAEAVEHGDFIIMAGDRSSRSGGRASVSQPFLGGTAPFPRGTFRLAAALGCPVYTLFLMSEGSGYDLHTHPLADEADGADGIRTRFVGRMEEMCVRYPDEWFNFYPFWD